MGVIGGPRARTRRWSRIILALALCVLMPLAHRSVLTGARVLVRRIACWCGVSRVGAAYRVPFARNASLFDGLAASAHTERDSSAATPAHGSTVTGAGGPNLPRTWACVPADPLSTPAVSAWYPPKCQLPRSDTVERSAACARAAHVANRWAAATSLATPLARG